jgi:hypothetical protein
MQHRSVWKSVYPAETRNCFSWRDEQDIPWDYSSCSYLDDWCFWKLCYTKGTCFFLFEILTADYLLYNSMLCVWFINITLLFLNAQFLDQGTESQRIELASQLTGHVLPLSLQMYGCRVIQKVLFWVPCCHKYMCTCDMSMMHTLLYFGSQHLSLRFLLDMDLLEASILLCEYCCWWCIFCWAISGSWAF